MKFNTWQKALVFAFIWPYIVLFILLYVERCIIGMNLASSIYELLRKLTSVIVTSTKVFKLSKIWEGIKPIARKVILVNSPLRQLNRLIKRLHNFISLLRKVEKHHGTLFTIKWLKGCQVALQRSIGNNPVKTLREIDPDLPLPRTINGLPWVIPRGDRHRIRKGNESLIRWWMTLFGLFRVLKAPYELKVDTILNDFMGDDESLKKFLVDSPFAISSFKALKGYQDWRNHVVLAPKIPLLLRSASPNSSISWVGLICDLKTLIDSDSYKYFIGYLRLIKASDFIEKFYQLRNLSKDFETELLPFCRKPALGRISFKEEPAGKLRLFAMVDIWTQSCLFPLHKELFNLLKIIPNDGTLDQDLSVNRSKEKSLKAGKAFSFDLTAATDRLPVSIQSLILDRIFDSYPGIGELWKGLLVERDYVLPRGKYKTSYTEDSVKYRVGQPMGAYSSWAMLAITHHWILQHSSFLLGKSGWNEDYEILGDDLVIFDSDLADQYLKICKSLGVEINISKSIISSKPVFEFAKRLIHFGTDVSPIHFKQFIGTNVSARVENLIYYFKVNNKMTAQQICYLLARFEFRSLKEISLPMLSLWGRVKTSLEDIISVIIDPGAIVFSIKNAKTLPLQSLLSAIKETLKGNSSYEIPKKSDRLWLLNDISEELASEVKQEINRYKFIEMSGRINSEFNSGVVHTTDPNTFYSDHLLGGVSADAFTKVQLRAWFLDVLELAEGELDIINICGDFVDSDSHNFQHHSLEQSLEVLDRVESVKFRFDLKRPINRNRVYKLGPLWQRVAKSLGSNPI
jgi:hypothetical protein